MSASALLTSIHPPLTQAAPPRLARKHEIALQAELADVLRTVVSKLVETVHAQDTAYRAALELHHAKQQELRVRTTTQDDAPAQQLEPPEEPLVRRHALPEALSMLVSLSSPGSHLF